MTTPHFTPEQAKLVVEQAGLDPSKPLNEQVGESERQGDVAHQLAALSERVDRLADTFRQAGHPADPSTTEERFAQGLAQQLSAAQSRWYSTGGESNDG